MLRPPPVGRRASPSAAVAPECPDPTNSPFRDEDAAVSTTTASATVDEDATTVASAAGGVPETAQTFPSAAKPWMEGVADARVNQSFIGSVSMPNTDATQGDNDGSANDARTALGSMEFHPQSDSSGSRSDGETSRGAAAALPAPLPSPPSSPTLQKLVALSEDPEQSRITADHSHKASSVNYLAMYNQFVGGSVWRFCFVSFLASRCYQSIHRTFRSPSLTKRRVGFNASDHKRVCVFCGVALVSSLHLSQRLATTKTRTGMSG